MQPVICKTGTLKRLQRSLLLFYTGRQRSADELLAEQRHAVQDGRALKALQSMRELAVELRERLGRGDADALGPLLHQNWELKQGLTDGITDTTVDRWYELAREAGATGGKLLGAGGGGFLLLFAPPDRHNAVRAALADLRAVPLKFAAQGTHIAVLGREGA